MLIPPMLVTIGERELLSKYLFKSRVIFTTRWVS